MHYGIKDSVGARTLDYESGSLSSIPSLPFNLLRLSMWCHNSLTSRTFRQCCFCWAKYPLFGSIWVFYWIFWFSSKSFRLGKQSLGASRRSTLSLVFICPQVVKCLVICASSLRVLCSVLLNKEYLETEESGIFFRCERRRVVEAPAQRTPSQGLPGENNPLSTLFVSSPDTIVIKVTLLARGLNSSWE